MLVEAHICCALLFLYELFAFFRLRINHSAKIRLGTQPSQATERYTSIGGSSKLLVIAYFHALNVSADKVSA